MPNRTRKKCRCGKDAKPHYEGGLYCGDDLCDECFCKMVDECRSRSY